MKAEPHSKKGPKLNIDSVQGPIEKTRSWYVNTIHGISVNC